ncbi:MAG: C-GCAxxG-C-C family (seleno)protein [Sedimentibacter sp.]
MAEGFFGVLADEVGYPFNQIPVATFVNYGSGFQQASLCGSLGAAAACIGTVCDADTSKKILVELENWYKETAFPMYQPENLNLATTVADSILCSDSVGKWMEETGYEHGSPERKSRCAGVTADTAKKMVELLNVALA